VFAGELAQDLGPLFQMIRVVSGKAEHAVAVLAKQGAQLPPLMTMIDEQRLVGFLFADAAFAVLLRHHAIVVRKGTPASFERLLALTEDFFFPIFGILLPPPPKSSQDFLFVGVVEIRRGSELLFSICRILCISFLSTFVFVVGHDFNPSRNSDRRDRSIAREMRHARAASRRRVSAARDGKPVIVLPEMISATAHAAAHAKAGPVPQGTGSA